MRHGEHGFLDRGIRRLTLHQDVPRNERAVILLGRRLGPARPQQSLVRKRSSRRTRSSDCLARSKLPDSNSMVPSTRFDLSRIASPAGSPAAQPPGLVQLLDRFLSCRPSCNSAMPRL